MLLDSKRRQEWTLAAIPLVGGEAGVMKEGKTLSLKGEPSVSWLKWTLAQLVGSRLFSHEEGEPSVS